MALIKCPECGRENVSNQAVNCPNCGYDIKTHFEKAQQEKIESWKERVNIALNKDETHKISELLLIGEEGYYSGYLQLGLYYDSKGAYDEAYQYYMLALELSPENPNILNNIGYLYSNRNFSKFNIELAIKFLLQSDIGTAHSNLAGIYRDKSYGEYANMDKAIEHYHKALEKGYVKSHVLNNLGTLYGDYKKDFVFASCYCYLSAKMGNSNGEQNYKIYISWVSNRDIWESNIKTLKDYSEINQMIAKVSGQISKSTTSNHGNQPQQKIYSKKVKTAYVVGVAVFTFLLLWFVFGVLAEGFFTLGDEFVARGIFVIVFTIAAIAFIATMIYHRVLADNRPTAEEARETNQRIKYNNYRYTCPNCGSKKVKLIGTMNRAFSIHLFGLASSKIGKQYHCDDCKHNW